MHRGDGGVDSFTGSFGEGGEADVYQVKYFVTPWGDAQKQQIRDSYGTARESKDYNLGKWTLCVPVRLTKDDIRWFDDWRGKQDRKIELMDGDDLTAELGRSECALARTKLRDWGVPGLQAGGPQFSGKAFIRKPNYEVTGLTAIIVLRLENEGDRSARNIHVIIKHSETGTYAHLPHEDWQDCGSACVNPYSLRYRHTLNPGDQATPVSVPLSPRTLLPLTISIKLTADACRPSFFRCELTQEQITNGASVAFETTTSESAVLGYAGERRRQVEPTSPGAKEVLKLILEHPVPDERGATVVLQSPVAADQAVLIPNNTGAGGAMLFRKSQLRSAIEELVQLGWLAAPEEDDKTQVYDFIQNSK